MGRTALIMTMIALTTASHAGGVKVEVLRPAEITVPSSVQLRRAKSAGLCLATT